MVGAAHAPSNLFVHSPVGMNLASGPREGDPARNNLPTNAVHPQREARTAARRFHSDGYEHTIAASVCRTLFPGDFYFRPRFSGESMTRARTSPGWSLLLLSLISASPLAL